MRHKKIPTKNRKKLKQVDPFNKKGAATRAAALQKCNWEPSTDEQPIARSLIELKESAKAVDKKEVKKRKQHRNRILEEASRVGLTKGRFEGMQQFIRRVERTTYRDIDEHTVAVTQGLAGRHQEDLDADFRILEEKEERHKEQKKREIENKIKAARTEKERKAQAIKDKLEAKMARQEERKRELEKQKKQEAGDVEEEKKKETLEDVLGMDEKPMKKSEKGKKRAEKEKERKRVEAKHRRDDALLNSKEIIRFGERVDEPPKFEGMFKKKMDNLMAKAGGKQLLLHSIMKKETGVKTDFNENAKRGLAGEEERQRVIEAYREMKRRRNHM